MGTAPSSITTLVCSEVPEATLVSAQAASNCKANQQQAAASQHIHSGQCRHVLMNFLQQTGQQLPENRGTVYAVCSCTVSGVVLTECWRLVCHAALQETSWCSQTCSCGISARLRKPTNWGMTFCLMTSSMGGLRSAGCANTRHSVTCWLMKTLAAFIQQLLHALLSLCALPDQARTMPNLGIVQHALDAAVRAVHS